MVECRLFKKLQKYKKNSWSYAVTYQFLRFQSDPLELKKNTLQMNELGPKNCQICSFFREVQLSKFFFQNSMDYYEENDKFNNVFWAMLVKNLSWSIDYI